ncbi:hypothetical protein F5Y09DRAFT_356955 [Xylaria sp. FL1042]|nr:hypothetical protein F5Y09DRAFT_356955 [Xylaria sp. FL1042]
MGNGLFAICDIPQGTRILAEAPILSTSSVLRHHDQLPEFCNLLQRLSKAKLKELDQLKSVPKYTGFERQRIRQIVRQWYKHQAFGDVKRFPLKGKDLREFAETTVTRFEIFLFLAEDLGVDSSYGTGVFPLWARVNHSCIPNSYKWYNLDIKRLTLHAIRDIQAGEEITADYYGGIADSHEQFRLILLSKWIFECSCEACTNPAYYPERQHMYYLNKRLKIYRTQNEEGSSAPGRSLMPRNHPEAIQDLEDLIESLKRQGMESSALVNTYRTCSMFNLEAKISYEDALHYAEKAAELQRRIMGTETEHLRQDMVGAEYWLEYVRETVMTECDEVRHISAYPDL